MYQNELDNMLSFVSTEIDKYSSGFVRCIFEGIE